LVGLTVCLAAFARKPGPLAIAGFAVGVATILESSSRESLVSLATASLVVIALYLQELNHPRLVVLLASSCVALVLAAVALDPYVVDLIGYLKSDVLLLDSQQRGLGSGFTGRFEIWGAAIDIWLRSPILGVGLRQHEFFMPDMAPAHNSYLAILADTGLAGLVVYIALLFRSLFAALGMQDQRTRHFAAALIVAYIVSGFFDRRTIDGGNPYSLFFLLCCTRALADLSLRRVVAALRRGPHGSSRGVSLDSRSLLPGR
jgi:O-antigen ligase